MVQKELNISVDFLKTASMDDLKVLRSSVYSGKLADQIQILKANIESALADLKKVDTPDMQRIQLLENLLSYINDTYSDQPASRPEMPVAVARGVGTKKERIRTEPLRITRVSEQKGFSSVTLTPDAPSMFDGKYMNPTSGPGFVTGWRKVQEGMSLSQQEITDINTTLTANASSWSKRVGAEKWAEIQTLLTKGDVEGAMKLLQTSISGTPWGDQLQSDIERSTIVEEKTGLTGKVKTVIESGFNFDIGLGSEENWRLLFGFIYRHYILEGIKPGGILTDIPADEFAGSLGVEYIWMKGREKVMSFRITAEGGYLKIDEVEVNEPLTIQLRPEIEVWLSEVSSITLGARTSVYGPMKDYLEVYATFNLELEVPWHPALYGTIGTFWDLQERADIPGGAKPLLSYYGSAGIAFDPFDVSWLRLGGAVLVGHDREARDVSVGGQGTIIFTIPGVTSIEVTGSGGKGIPTELKVMPTFRF
ncbi:MAG: hypothetical protein PHU63_02695 [Candidatus ainarchaeum sp.]|nr:hypothetical protein [Candidatus ainarchaeum sp.]